MATDADLLDPGLYTQRVESYSFAVLDKANNVIGSCNPVRTVQLGNDTQQGVKRRLTNFVLTPSDTAAIDPLSNRIRAYMTLSNGSRYVLGTFLYADALVHRRSFGLSREGSLGDFGIFLTQPLDQSLTFAAGTLTTNAIVQVLNLAGITNYTIDSSNATIGTPMTFQGGQNATTYIAVLIELCRNAGFLDGYFTSAGTYIARTSPDLATVVPTLIYNDGGRIMNDSIVEQNDLIGAPNRWKVVEISATMAEITGEYALPATYPNSYDRIGRYITKHVECVGVANNDQANECAQMRALADPKGYETVSWSSPNDPRHETWDVVTFRSNPYLELSWAMPLTPGGPMTHTAKRVYLT